MAEGVIFLPDTHQYFRGERELVSVTRVIKSVWPMDSDFSGARPDVLENARERGIEVDEIFSRWTNNEFAEEMPPGYREDSTELAAKLIDWWCRENFENAGTQAQVVLADNEIAGTVDVLNRPKFIYDVKTTYNLEAYYPVQVGGYCDLYGRTYGVFPERAGIIHVTKRFKEPKLIELNPREIVHDWRVLRTFWLMVNGRTKDALHKKGDLNHGSST
jgi:hypothetical protein